jgi:hypothetical protein
LTWPCQLGLIFCQGLWLRYPLLDVFSVVYDYLDKTMYLGVPFLTG